MINTGFKKILMIAICLQFLSSCYESKKANPKAIQNGTNQTNDLAKSSGTGDSGGGNAIDFKMLESFIIDPTELDATKERVLPALINTYKDEDTKNFVGNENLPSKNSEDEALNEAKKISMDLFKIKTWYLAPVSLKQLPKEVLGIEFTESNLQQIAIQTENEVWIDSQLFGQMNKQEQARLIMHELVMSLYLLNFANIEDICTIAKKINFKESKTNNYSCDNPEYKNSLAKLINPQPKRKLNGNDYNSIREATSFIFNHTETMSENLWKRKLKSLKFDSIYTFQSKTTKSSSKKISKEEFMSYFKTAELTNKLPSHCHFSTLKETVPCHLQFEYLNKLSESEPDIIKFSIISADGAIKNEYNIKTWSDFYLDGDENNLEARIHLRSLPSYQIGEKILKLEIVLKNNELTELSIIQHKLVNITKETKKDSENNELDCTTYDIKSFIPKNISEDSIFITTGHIQSESFNILHMNQLYNSNSGSCNIIPKK